MGTLIQFPQQTPNTIRRPEPSEGPAAKSCHPERSEGPAFLRTSNRFTFWLKTAQALALAVAVCFTVGATDAGKRYDNLNHRLMCTCGCAEILGECNHVGCPNSTEELDLLRSGIDSGDTDKKIFDTFAARYGATVLAAPPASGFNLVAWIAPFAVFAAALLGTILLVRHWSIGKSELATQPADPEMDALRDRVRRETGEEGGY
jgi:cytochrome c-type biogenesis protein CcmH/NrfF